MYVCICNAIADTQIRQAAESGVRSLWELQKELGGRGLQFVGIAIDSPQAVQEFSTTQNINYPILIGDESAIRMSKQLGNRFQGLPFSVIFDRTGAVVYVQAGELKKDTIRDQTATLL